MKYAIIADIHAHPAALQAVLHPRDETRKDEIRKASYVTYDLDKEWVELRRVECPPPGFPPDSGGDFPVPPRRGPGPLLSETKEPEP